MIPIVEMTSFIHACAGGWSRMLAAFLHMLLLGPQGLATAGVTCVINGLPLTIYAKVGNILADYDGVRIGWDWRGANCIRPCLRCANLFKKKYRFGPSDPQLCGDDLHKQSHAHGEKPTAV